jgi:superfamily II DNA or RNA helicase
MIGIEPPGGVSVIKHLRDRQVLAKADYSPLYTGLNYELSASDKRYLERYFDFPPGLLARLAGDEIRNLEIARRLVSALGSDRQILFFGCSVEHSRFMAALMMYLGYHAVHIDGGSSKALRAEAIEDFRAGRLQLLCNYGILSTGFDAPKTDVVFISRPTQSVVLYSQMIGRGLRGPAIGGTEQCEIIDVRDNITGFGDQERVYEHFDEYWY